MKKQKLVYLFSFLILSLFFIIFSIYLKMSSEIEFLNIENQFTAQRNEVGIWKIKASSPEKLGFAFGCVHAHDRLFQTELMRRYGTGRLSEWFGEMALSRDRFMRFGAEVAKWEWQQIISRPELIETKQMLEGYVNGRSACIKKANTPIEFRLMKISLNSSEDWKPWEILAITKTQAADFSYDYRDEVGRYALSQLFGKDYAKILAPPEPINSKALYDQVDLQGLIKPQEVVQKITSPNLFSFFPSSSSVSIKNPTPSFSMSDVAYSGFDLVSLGAFNGASNAWVVSTNTAYLCNDTHLSLMWPSVLYPIEYELEQGTTRVIGSGFNLPGLPTLIIGKVVVEEKNIRKSVLEWGITIANYVDAQNLIQIDDNSSSRTEVSKQKFLVVDPKTHQSNEFSFDEIWTEWGPRVENVIDWMSSEPPPPNTKLALHWSAFQKKISAAPFFVTRTLHGSENLQQDFKSWLYPSVNFNWLEWTQEKGLWAGHIMTGSVFSENSIDARSQHFTFLTEDQARSLSESNVLNRPHLYKKIDSETKLFFATANHRIYSGDLGLKIAYHWQNGSRANRLIETKEQIKNNPSSAQSDLTSNELLNFSSWISKNINKDFLCKNDLPICEDIFLGLGSFNGIMSVDSWQATVLSLWERELKLTLWKINPRSITDDARKRGWFELHRWWDRSPHSSHALFDILNDPEKQKLIQQHLGKSILDLAKISWQKATSELLTTDSSFQNWKWENFHKVSWQHPFLRLPGVAGQIMKQFVFPEGPKIGGNNDSPSVMQYYWSASNPLDFSAVHGAVMKTCLSLDQSGKSTLKLANVTGVSGNPFSKFSKRLSEDYYFLNKHYVLEGSEKDSQENSQ